MSPRKRRPRLGTRKLKNKGTVCVMPRSHSTVKLSRDIPPPLPWSQQLVFLSTLRSWHCIPSFDCSSPPISSPPSPPGVSRIRPPLKSVTNSGLGGNVMKIASCDHGFPPSPPQPHLILLLYQFCKCLETFCPPCVQKRQVL